METKTDAQRQRRIEIYGDKDRYTETEKEREILSIIL